MKRTAQLVALAALMLTIAAIWAPPGYVLRTLGTAAVAWVAAAFAWGLHLSDDTTRPRR